jgi:hypothetical protein
MSGHPDKEAVARLARLYREDENLDESERRLAAELDRVGNELDAVEKRRNEVQREISALMDGMDLRPGNAGYESRRDAFIRLLARMVPPGVIRDVLEPAPPSKPLHPFPSIDNING